MAPNNSSFQDSRVRPSNANALSMSKGQLHKSKTADSFRALQDSFSLNASKGGDGGFSNSRSTATSGVGTQQSVALNASQSRSNLGGSRAGKGLAKGRQEAQDRNEWVLAHLLKSAILNESDINSLKGQAPKQAAKQKKFSDSRFGADTELKNRKVTMPSVTLPDNYFKANSGEIWLTERDENDASTAALTMLIRRCGYDLDIFADNEDQYEIKRKVLAKPRRDAQQAGAINATGTRREDEEHAGGSQDDEDDEAA